MKVTWTHLARLDVQIIYHMILKNNQNAADSWLKEVEKTRLLIKDFPFSGKVIGGSKNEEIRQLLFGQYKMIYTIDDDVATILTVRHGSIPSSDFMK